MPVSVVTSKGNPIKLLVGNPESGSLPLPGTGQREGGGFTEPFEQFLRSQFIRMEFVAEVLTLYN